MKRFLIATIVIATVLGASFAWLPPELKAGLRYALPDASPSPTRPTPERQPPAKCLDGTPLTVTSRDSNQTDYRCGSGAIGAYTN